MAQLESWTGNLPHPRCTLGLSMCLGAININPRGLSGKFHGPLSSPSLDLQGSHRVQSENPVLRKPRSPHHRDLAIGPLLASSQMPVRSHGRTTAVCRPKQFSTPCLEKSRNGLEVFWYAPTDYFTCLCAQLLVASCQSITVISGTNVFYYCSAVTFYVVWLKIDSSWWTKLLLFLPLCFGKFRRKHWPRLPSLHFAFTKIAFCHRCQKSYSCGDSHRCKNKLWVEKEAKVTPNILLLWKAPFFLGGVIFFLSTQISFAVVALWPH